VKRKSCTAAGARRLEGVVDPHPVCESEQDEGSEGLMESCSVFLLFFPFSRLVC
jgi:hypothetical protein